MNISEAIEKIISLQITGARYWIDAIGYKTAIADILQELLDTGGVGKEYMEAKK